jgi:hypothetical protein
MAYVRLGWRSVFFARTGRLGAACWGRRRYNLCCGLSYEARIPTGPLFEAEVVIRPTLSGKSGRGPYAVRFPLLSFDGTTMGGMLACPEFITTLSWQTLSEWESAAVLRYESLLPQFAAQQGGPNVARANQLQVRQVELLSGLFKRNIALLDCICNIV